MSLSSSSDDVKLASLDKLSKFKLVRVLSEDSVSKRIALLGRMEGEDGDALLVLERIAIAREAVSEMIASVSQLHELISNDVYGLYRGFFSAKYSPVKVNLTFPASARDIAKMETQEYIRVEETPEIYSKISLPYIAELPSSRVQWVYNILDKTSESERIICESTDPGDGFLLVPDFKWDEKDSSMLYCLAICHRRDIHSLRDLTADHLPLLKNIRDRSYASLKQKFGVSGNRLRAFVHYHPTFYHFHVHFVHSSVVNHGIVAGKAHMLEDIIDNLQLDSEYYRRRTLACFFPEMHDLYQRIVSSASP